MLTKDTEKIYELYLESSFKYSNSLTKAEYENSSMYFDYLYRSVLPENKKANIVDIGCGAGHFLFYLNRHGYENSIGIDVSQQQIDFCRDNISENVQQADVFDFLADKKSVYDLVIAHDLLEHIPRENSLSLVKLIYEALNENGTLILRVPNMSNPFSIDSRYRDITHVNGFTEKSMYQILCVGGFKKIKITSSKIMVQNFKNKIRKYMVSLLKKMIQFFFYIQDFAVPRNLGKNLIVIAKKYEQN